MSATINNYNVDVNEINSNLNVLKRSGASYDNILEIINEYREKFTEKIAEVRIKKDSLASFKDEKMKKVEKVQMIMKEKDEKIKKIHESVDQYTNISKKVIAEINFSKLNKVKKDPSIIGLWKFFYCNLYREHENTFNYDDFVKIALNKRLDDFQAKLANFQISNLDREQREKIKDLKNQNYP